MYAINYPYMKHWPEARLDVLRTESCSLAGARRVAAMLDIDPDVLAEGTPLPRGWHFILLGADTRRSALRGDGFPGLGVPMPNLGISRLMLGGANGRVSRRDPRRSHPGAKQRGKQHHPQSDRRRAHRGRVG